MRPGHIHLQCVHPWRLRVREKGQRMKLAGTWIVMFLSVAMLSGCASGRTEAPAGQPASEAAFPSGAEEVFSSGTETPFSGRAEPERSEPSEVETAVSGTAGEESAGEREHHLAGPVPLTALCPAWADYFGDLNGTAVVYDPDENTFWIYNADLADARSSPCSTFKIISSLTGMENGVIDPSNSVRSWSGESFWNDDWNRDIDFYDAFRTSCVWYYRQVVDDIGPDMMQEALDALQYGNCDLSDWAGRLNTNNSNPALTGFWLESSLKISPREQTEVMERIFGSASRYSADARAALKEVMLLPVASQDSCMIYGKTGMGKRNGVVVDAWYTGFADIGRRIYFCVRLGETKNQDVSSTRAREIAVSLIKENFRLP